MLYSYHQNEGDDFVPTDNGPYVKFYINDIKKFKDISSQDIILFYIIKALSGKYGFCNASNKTLSSISDISEKNINRNLNHLIKNNYIKIERDKENFSKKIIIPLK